MRNEMNPNIPCTSCPMQCDPLWTASNGSDLPGSPSESYPVLVAGLRPGAALQLLFEEECEDFLPCFGEDETIEELSDLGVLISFDSKHVITLGSSRFLYGPALFYNVDEEGNLASLCYEEICQIKQQAQERTLPFRFAGLEAAIFRLD